MDLLDNLCSGVNIPPWLRPQCKVSNYLRITAHFRDKICRVPNTADSVGVGNFTYTFLAPEQQKAPQDFVMSDFLLPLVLQIKTSKTLI